MSNTTVATDIKGPTVIQKPVVADLDVKESRVTGSATAKRSITETEIKQMAVYDALKKSNSDVLVEPRYEITTNMKETTVTVTGYPGTYKNFRPMEVQDTMFIDRAALNTVKTDRPKAKKNQRAKRIAAWSVGGVAGAIGLFFLSFLFF